MSNNSISSPVSGIPQLWVVTEGMAGTENQCIAVAQSLGIQPVVKRIGLSQPWQSLSPYLGFECAHSFNGDALTAPFPDIVIAAGRKAIAACRYIKKQSPKSFIVFLQNPRMRSSAFDLIAAPAHDHLSGANIITTVATPTKFNPTFCETIRKNTACPFQTHDKIKIGLLIGGGIAGRVMSTNEQDKIIKTIQDLQKKSDTELFVIGSRRTPLILSQTISSMPITSWFTGDANPNPYEAVISYSDIVIVTADSPSMLSDAASAGKATYSLGEPQTRRHAYLISQMIKAGHIKDYQEGLIPFTPSLLNDAALVAAEIRRKTGL